ncbi:MAG: succinyl-CoA synthetase beta subunit [Chloroflexota bacterium]|jgi:succinyl-CoA synthetase beta subunit|nr:succinyl-CoA synthetase beta subunit [Chloroflexota bacterium]
MKLQEYHAKRLLLAQGLPVPDYSVAATVDEARTAAAGYLDNGSGRVVIKAQVLVGGRGKAGGVKLAGSADEAQQIASQILGMDIKGTTVQRVLVAPAADIVAEYYLACVLDRSARKVLLMGSAEGGVEIEVVAAERPDTIKQLHAHPLLGLLDHQARRMAFELGLGTNHLREFVTIAKGLYATMIANDADLVEINPLAIVKTAAGVELQCLDAKITVDDSALERHPDVEHMRDIAEEDPVDVQAREQGLSFIRLDGNIGCMVNGAGLAMTTMDLIKRAGGEPANFLDIGGGAKSDKVAAAMSLILGDESVKAILVNIFGGIARGDEVAHGLVEARRLQSRHVPMVVRIVGTNAVEAARILAEAGDPDLQTALSLDEAVERAVAAATEAVAA